MELIDYVRKFKEMCSKLKEDLEKHVARESAKLKALDSNIDACRKHAGEIRGQIKQSLKMIENGNGIDKDVFEKLRKLQEELDQYSKDSKEPELMKEKERIEFDIEKAQHCLKAISE